MVSAEESGFPSEALKQCIAEQTIKVAFADCQPGRTVCFQVYRLKKTPGVNV